METQSPELSKFSVDLKYLILERTELETKDALFNFFWEIFKEQIPQKEFSENSSLTLDYYLR